MDYDKLDADTVESLEHIKSLMNEHWEPLSREVGLKADSSYYGKDNPLIAMRDNMENLVADGVMKLLGEGVDMHRANGLRGCFNRTHEQKCREPSPLTGGLAPSISRQRREASFWWVAPVETQICASFCSVRSRNKNIPCWRKFGGVRCKKPAECSHLAGRRPPPPPRPTPSLRAEARAVVVEDQRTGAA
ncbi:MAG: hypothetical protein VB071_03750 [Lawsonibacter sp.]|nr:hypothetical protein [Lawsonibacter sp.]